MTGKNFKGRLAFFGLTMALTFMAPEFWSSSKNYFFVAVFMTVVFWEEIVSICAAVRRWFVK